MNTQTNNFALIGTQEEIINLIQNEIDKYNRSLEQLNLTKQQLSDDYTVIVEQQRDLSAKVRDKRAETQGYGRGSWGLVLGSGYRSARRREASFINAQISRQAADICNNLSAQKNQISARKRTINEEIRKTKQTVGN